MDRVLNKRERCAGKSRTAARRKTGRKAKSGGYFTEPTSGSGWPSRIVTQRPVWLDAWRFRKR